MPNEQQPSTMARLANIFHSLPHVNSIRQRKLCERGAVFIVGAILSELNP